LCAATGPRFDGPRRETGNMFELKIVRERRQGYGTVRRVRDAAQVYEAFRDEFGRLDREMFVALLLDGKNQVLGFNIVSIGSLTAALVHPREVFKPVILANAAAVILLHNHPSGSPEPSAEDRALTERLERAGELLGIRVLDHVIVGDGQYRSKGQGW
jgi:DNA repair protein RadC